MKCNLLNDIDYKRLQKEDESIPFFCITCIDQAFPFSTTTNKEFLQHCTHDSLRPDTNILTPSPTLVQNSPLIEAHINKLNTYLNQNISQQNEGDSDDQDDDSDHSPINCNYYDREEFTHANFNSSKAYSILHLNIHSITAHFEELQDLLMEIHSDNFQFDIIAISESKLKPHIEPIININLDNYHPPTGMPSEAEKGGVLLYVNERIKDYKIRTDLNNKMYEPKLLESVFIEVTNTKSANDIIGVVYRHPTMDLNTFNDNHLKPIIDNLSLERNKKVYIAGDFNVNLLNVSHHSSSSDFFDILCSNHLLPSISIPTKLNNSGNHTLIDNIFINTFNPDTISGNITFNVSDGHLPSFVIIPKPNQNHLPKKHNFYKRSLKNFNPSNNNFDSIKTAALQDIRNLDLTNVMEIEKSDVNLSFSNFLEAINPVLDKYMPLVKVSNKIHKRRYKPWITQGIRKSIQNRDKLLRKITKMKDPERIKLLTTEHKIKRNMIVNLTRTSKQNFYNEYFTANNGNLRKVWQGIKDIINIKSRSFESPTTIIDNGNIIKDPREIPNCFVKHYTSVADNILNERNYNGDGNYQKYLPPQPSPESIFMRPCDSAEISIIINKFNIHKGTGPNSIPPLFLHHMLSALAEPLSLIANLCLVTGTHPDKLKLAKITPIYKKGSKLLTCNYRPISLLSNINKIFEKLIHSRVLAFLNNHNTFYKHQYGFRPKHSTNHTLINITETIRDALDQGKYACGVFVDFQKAFDTVNHSILLGKLNHYGIRGQALNWFKSYLYNRKQFVSVLGFESEKLVMKHGVPQGSVLGPLLFLIYINDLHRSINDATTYHFADDTHLLAIDKCPHTIQTKLNRDLKGLYKWLLANKISLNATKTELVIFRKPSTTKPQINLKINGTRIHPSTNIKYLGVYLDEYLNGEAHCNQLQKKLNRAKGMIAKSRHYLTNREQNLLAIYHSIYSSHLIYGCQIWGQTNTPAFNKIKVNQNNALRLISFATSFRDHVSPIYHMYKLLKLRDYITLQNLLLVHDYFNNKLPASFDSYFTLLINMHNHGTRGALHGQLWAPNVETVRYGRNSIKNQAIISWNNFIKEFPADTNFINCSRPKFKKCIVKHFTSKYASSDT